jgi:hypothetical protein
MYRIYRLIIDGCWHKWSTVHAQDIHNENGCIIGNRFIHQCTRCGMTHHEDHK